MYLDFFGVLDLIRTSGDAFVVYCAVDLGWGQLSLEVEVDIVVEEDSLRRHRFRKDFLPCFQIVDRV